MPMLSRHLPPSPATSRNLPPSPAIPQEYSGPVKDALLALLHGPADWCAPALPLSHSQARPFPSLIHKLAPLAPSLLIHKLAPLAPSLLIHKLPPLAPAPLSLPLSFTVRLPPTTILWIHRYAAQLKAAFAGQETNDKRVCRILGAHDKEEVRPDCHLSAPHPPMISRDLP